MESYPKAIGVIEYILSSDPGLLTKETYEKALKTNSTIFSFLLNKFNTNYRCNRPQVKVTNLL